MLIFILPFSSSLQYRCPLLFDACHVPDLLLGFKNTYKIRAQKSRKIHLVKLTLSSYDLFVVIICRGCTTYIYSTVGKSISISTGNITIKLLPSPGSLSTHILPPWALTIAFVMVSPIPAPPVFLVLDLSVR